MSDLVHAVESTKAHDLLVNLRPVNSLRPYQNNARTHSKPQIRQIADSIRAFGFTNPILLDKTGMIIAGHGRVEAAKLLKMNEVPTIELTDLTEDEVRAYILADNRLAEKAGWNDDILKIELQYLMNLDIGLDVTITGFEIAEIDLLLQEDSSDVDDELPADSGPSITNAGDMWVLGAHRILCGSSLSEDSYLQLMNDKRADVVFSDPPYNVTIDGNVCGNGAIKHDEFAMASGEMSEEQFTTFLSESLSLLARYSRPGSVHFICMDFRHIGELTMAGKRVYDTLLNLCVWVKDNGGMGSFYRSRHELVFVFRNGKASHRNNIQLGRFGRNRTNVWEFPGVNTMSKQSEEGNLLALHPTVKPISLVAEALLDCSAPKEIVLDAFLGSGTTLLAAQRTGRVCYGIELDPRYVDVAVRRWQNMTGLQAVHAKTGKVFGNQPKKGKRNG